MRKTILTIAASTMLMTGCLTTGDVMTAQQQYFASLQAQQEAERSYNQTVIQALSAFSSSQDPLVQAWAMSSIERIASSRSMSTMMNAAANQGRMPDGPITSFLKAALPYVLPIAQIWAADRTDKRSLESAALQTGLIGNIVNQISRDPLVVQPPPTQIVQPTVIDREVPFIVEPVIFGVTP